MEGSGSWTELGAEEGGDVCRFQALQEQGEETQPQSRAEEEPQPTPVTLGQPQQEPQERRTVSSALHDTA